MHLISITIAKNESRNIAQCLTSAARFGCTDLVLVDTGSDDDTVAAAQAACVTLPAILHVHRVAWTGYSDARNAALDAARALGTDPRQTVALVLDADEHLIGNPAAAYDLDAPCLWLQEGAHGASYIRPRLLRLDHPWRCVGRVHETWEAPGQTGKGELLSGLTVGSHGQETRYGPEKFARYLELLRQDEQDGVTPTRTAYYLAQTLNALGQHAAAADYARRRLAMPGGWDQETYCTRLELVSALWPSDQQAAITAACEAVALRRDRSEAAVALSGMLHATGQHLAALRVALCAIADRQLWPSTDTMFVDSAALFKLHEAVAVAAWHCNQAAVGLRSALAIANNPAFTDAQRARGAELAGFFA